MLNALPSLRHLQVLEAVARLNSLTRASAEIHLTQPAVTQTIARLEATVGAALFERRITGTYLTPAGELYLERTERVFRGIEEVLRQIRPNADKAEISRRVGKITRAQVRALIALSQSQSQTQAAALLGISQASLHRAARDLECNVGAMLYHRAATGVITTDAGQLLACRLQLAINELDEICSQITAAQETRHRCIRIGALVLDPAALLSPVMVQFTRAYPNAVVKVIHASYDILQQKLRSGALDFIVGVVKGPAPDLATDPLFVDPYVIAARRDHPLARKHSVEIEDLLGYDWVVVNQGAPRHAAFARLFAASGEMPSTTIETHSLATIRMAVAQSDRLTLLTRSELRAEESSGLFTALTYPSLVSAPVIGITRRSDWSACGMKQAFIDLLIERGRALQTQETGGVQPLAAHKRPAARRAAPRSQNARELADIAERRVDPVI
ncbi:LysR family transcriptional regulator [Novosphingobium flavum]|uniref:LysR family transcriptional regulator n=1 Tax=Novosphingobium flavum TaxID=1778672 RepID=A0A7X1FQV8_9SPHN|nr:LysR family transcriptional regulator [Novosphingobium flavum]MBC2665299.1 LysR family transcriptional regulator [Novosphingobium flavum]